MQYLPCSYSGAKSGHREVGIFGVGFGDTVSAFLTIVESEVLLQKLATKRASIDVTHKAAVALR